MRYFLAVILLLTTCTGQILVRSGVTLSGGVTVQNYPPIPASYFGLQTNTVNCSNGLLPVPSAGFEYGTLRLWDASNYAENPFTMPTGTASSGGITITSPLFSTLLDPCASFAKTNNLQLILNMARIPDWASSWGSRCTGAGTSTSGADPTCSGAADYNCAYASSYPATNAGECDPPWDLPANGIGGTDNTYKTLVNTVATHLAGLSSSTYVTHAIFEPWNEMNIGIGGPVGSGGGQWAGDLGQMIRMTDDVAPLILAANPANIVTSPNSVEWYNPFSTGATQYQHQFFQDGVGIPILPITAYTISGGTAAFTFTLQSPVFIPVAGQSYRITGTGNTGLDGSIVSVLSSPAPTSTTFSVLTSATGSGSGLSASGNYISIPREVGLISMHLYMAASATGQFPCYPGPSPNCSSGIAPPEELINLITQLHRAVPTWVNYGIIGSEASWGQSNSTFCDPDMRKAYVGRLYLLGWPLGISNIDWYHYDDTHNCSTALATPNTGTHDTSCDGGVTVPGQPTYEECPAGTAYQQAYFWMVGNIMDAPCLQVSGVFTCHFSNANGTTSLAVWATSSAYTCSGGVCPTENYSVTGPYTVYYTLDNSSSTTISGGCSGGCTVAIGAKPILLHQ